MIQRVEPDHAAFKTRRANHRLDVAVQVAFERQALKPGIHLTGSRVQTRRFQAMGQLIFNVYSPTLSASSSACVHKSGWKKENFANVPSPPLVTPGVVAPVEFESKGLKPGYHM
jgi:hypothetical protein